MLAELKRLWCFNFGRQTTLIDNSLQGPSHRLHLPRFIDYFLSLTRYSFEFAQLRFLLLIHLGNYVVHVLDLIHDWCWNVIWRRHLGCLIILLNLELDRNSSSLLSLWSSWPNQMLRIFKWLVHQLGLTNRTLLKLGNLWRLLIDSLHLLMGSRSIVLEVENLLGNHILILLPGNREVIRKIFTICGRLRWNIF